MPDVTGRGLLYGLATVVVLGWSPQWAGVQDEMPMPASPTPPPDVQEREKLEKVKPPAPPGRSPDLNELLDQIRKQPGGADQLERARKAGAKIPTGPVGTGGEAVNSRAERLAGPRIEGPTFDFFPAEKQGAVLKVTRAASYQNVTGLGQLSVNDLIPYYTASGSLWGPYYRWANPTFPFGSQDLKPFLTASVNVVSSGWYIINFLANKGKASLRTYDGTLAYPTLMQWDYSTSPNYYESYPALVNLTSGWHYFYWIPDVGTWFYVSEVSVTKL